MPSGNRNICLFSSLKKKIQGDCRVQRNGRGWLRPGGGAPAEPRLAGGPLHRRQRPLLQPGRVRPADPGGLLPGGGLQRSDAVIADNGDDRATAAAATGLDPSAKIVLYCLLVFPLVGLLGPPGALVVAVFPGAGDNGAAPRRAPGA